MNTHTIDPRTIWALLTMEAGLVLALISLPTQGDRLPGLLGPLLLLALLPAGYAAVREIATLRDPSSRLLTGIGLALLTRAIVSSVPEPGIPGLASWLGHSAVPMAIGIGLWWRGGALAVSEYTAAEVRTEFGVLAICLIGALALVRPFLLSDPVLLGASVGLFALGGLVATAMSRQDAAEVVALRFGRTLATGSAVLPALTAVALVSILRPALLTTMWLTLAHIIELVLTPIGLLIAWLASLFPAAGRPPVPPPPLPRPMTEPAPDPAALAELQERLGWISWVVLIMLLVVGTVAALLVVRLLLANFVNVPARRAAKDASELTVERTGTPRADAQDFFGWLMRWLRGLGSRQAAARPHRQGSAHVDAVDAWSAYQQLLAWAARQGAPRRPPETTGQLQARLSQQAPEAATAVDLITTTYEYERYGDVHPPSERLQRLRAALAALAARTDR
jgi:hypothetical protein